MVDLIIYSHLGTRLIVASLIPNPPPTPTRAGVEQTQEPPQLEKDFERLIVCGYEWLRSQGSHTGMQLMKKSIIFPKPTFCRRSGTSPTGWWASQLFTSELRFQGWLISQASPAPGRESKDPKLQRGIWFQAPPGFIGCQTSPELREATWVVPAQGLSFLALWGGKCALQVSESMGLPASDLLPCPMN